METFSPSLPLATGAPFEVPSSPIQQYTTAQLLALSSSASAAIGIAYCTDCLTTKGILTDVGDDVRWNGMEWVTFTDDVPLTTSFNKLCFYLYQRNFNSNVLPGTTRWACNAASNANSGTAATMSLSASTTTNGQINQIIGTTGTTATGIASLRYNGYDTDLTNWNCRAIGMALNHVTVEQSVVGQTFSYRSGISTYSAAAVGALQLDEVCLVYDPDNTLGAGINTDNWWYLIRANGTTLFTGDTGIARTTPIWTIATIIPVGVNSVVAEIATAENYGANYTVHTSQTVTFSASPASATLCMFKASGTTAKTSTRQYSPKMYTPRMNNLTPTTVVY